MYSKQQGAAMVKYQRNPMDIEQIYTIKDQFVIHSDWWIDWFEIDWLIDWALVSQIYLVQQDEEHGHYFFYNGMKRKKKKIDFSKI